MKTLANPFKAPVKELAVTYNAYEESRRVFLDDHTSHLAARAALVWGQKLIELQAALGVDVVDPAGVAKVVKLAKAVPGAQPPLAKAE